MGAGGEDVTRMGPRVRGKVDQMGWTEGGRIGVWGRGGRWVSSVGR